MENKFKLFREPVKGEGRSSPHKPVSLVWFTLGYILVAVFVLIGLPAPNTGARMEIPREHMPLAIAIAAALYFFILGILFLLGLARKKLSS